MKKKLLEITFLSLLLILPTKILAGYYNLTEFKSQETSVTASPLMQYSDMGQSVENTGVFYLTSDYSNGNGTKPFSMKVQGNELDTSKNYILTFYSSATSSAQEHSYSGTELNEGITVTLPEENIPTSEKVTVTLREENTTNLINHTISVCENAVNPATCESTDTISYNTIILFFSYPNTNPNPGGGSGPSQPTADPEELERMQAFVQSTLTNNTLVLDTVDPTITSVDPMLADSLLTAAFVKKHSSKYETYVTPTDNNQAEIQLYYMDYQYNKQTSYTTTVNVQYATKDTSIDSILEEIKSKLNHTMDYYEESIENNFIIDDLDSLNYYFNTQKTNNELAALYLMPSYSSGIHNLTGNIGFDFMFDPRAGDAPNMAYDRVIGPINILYNGVVVENIDPIGFVLNRVIYIPSDTTKTRDAFIEAAQKRINEYLPGQDITIEYMADIADMPQSEYSWYKVDPQTHQVTYIPIIDVNKTNGEVYNITIGEQMIPYFIVADSSKMKTPVLKSVDKDTNIKVETNSYDVPLDSRINVRKLDKNSEEFKNLAKKFKILDDMAFDIDILSSSLDMKIETLANGSFKVYIPVDEKTTKKSLVAAYVKEDGTIEEHKITFEGNYAVFETNHFSTYSIVDKSNNPNTGDNVLKYGIILGISILGITGLTIYTKKNKKTK